MAVFLGVALVGAPQAANATHLTSVSLGSTSVPVGTAQAALTVSIDNNSDAVECYYGWSLSSSDGTLVGTTVLAPPGARLNGPVATLFVNTSALAVGVYNVSVTSDWDAPPDCDDDGNTVATATVTVTAIPRAGAFVCRAIPMRSGPTNHVPANPALAPCKVDYNSSLTLLLPPLAAAEVLAGDTQQTPAVLQNAAPKPTDHAFALATTAGVKLNVAGLTIALGAVQSLATASCVTGSPTVTSSSRVVGLSINGGPGQLITAYKKINLGLVVIELNKTTTTATSKTQQAVVITSIIPHSKIVIGEATAGYVGNPCIAAPA